MHKSTSAKRKSFRFIAIASVLSGAVGVLVGIVLTIADGPVLGLVPQIAVFMVPLTILVFAILFEVARLAWSNLLPEQTLERRSASQYWQAGRGEG